MRLVIVILLLLPGVAAAEPVSFFAAVGTFLSSAAITVGALTISWGTVIFAAGSLLYGQAAQRKQAKQFAEAAQQQRDAANASMQDRTISGVATEFPARYVYGEARVGTNIVAVLASGDRDEYKHLVGVLCQHEITAVDEIYINGVALGPLDANGGVTGGAYLKVETGSVSRGANSGIAITLAHTPLPGTFTVTGMLSDIDGSRNVVWTDYTLVGGVLTIGVGADPYIYSYQYRTETSMIRVIKHLGTATDPADPYLINDVGSSVWPYTSVLRGHSYLYVRLNLNQAEFQGGLPRIEALLRGKKLYDVRVGNPPIYSSNNAVVAYDYITSELGSVPTSAVPIASYISAANDCDDIVSTGAWSGPRFTFNGVITSEQARDDVLELIAQSMAGGIDGTTWEIYAGKFSAPVMALQQTDIVGELALSPGFPRNDIFNTVKGQFIGAENEYVQNDFTPYQNAAYLTSDGEELATNIDMPFTNTQQRCTNLARIATESNRNAFSLNGKFSRKAASLRVGNRVTFTSAFFGQTAKIYRVTDKGYGPSRTVSLGLKEDAEANYDLADAVLVDQTPNTNLPNPYSIEPLASLTCASGDAQLDVQADSTLVSRILVTWPLATTQGVLQNGYIELSLQEAGKTAWTSQQVAGNATSAYLSPVIDGKFYNVAARCVNPYVNTKSDWVYAPLHQVIGKTAPPSDVKFFTVDGNTLSWSAITDLDRAGYAIRFNYGRNADYGVGAPLHIGLITEAPWTPAIFPPGQITLMIKAIDTTGNESVNAATIFTNLGDIIVDNLILSYDDKAAGFPGSKTNATVVSGALRADDSGDLFWRADGANFWREDATPFWPTSTYLEAVYVLRYAVDADEAGSRLTLLATVLGDSYTIEYAYGTQGLFWGADADFFWGADAAAAFWPAPTQYQTWPGAVENIAEGDIFIRITMQAGVTQGAITALVLNFDVEDESEAINDLVVAAIGTRLPLLKSYRSIKNVQLTLQNNGGTAINAVTVDKSSTGPLTACINAAGAQVVGLIDARVQGVKGR